MTKDPLLIDVGYYLLQAADPRLGGMLCPAVAELRAKMLEEYRYVLPPVRIRDSSYLWPYQFHIYVQHILVCRKHIFPSIDLSVNDGESPANLEEAYAQVRPADCYPVWQAINGIKIDLNHYIVEFVIRYLEQTALQYADMVLSKK